MRLIAQQNLQRISDSVKQKIDPDAAASKVTAVAVDLTPLLDPGGARLMAIASHGIQNGTARL